MTYHYRLAARRIIAPGGPVSTALRALRRAVSQPPASGPVVEALRTMRAADPEFDLNPELRALRHALANRIEADLAALDALGGDADFEDGADAEPSLGAIGGTAASQGCGQLFWSRGNTDDREDGDDTGIGNIGGLAEQRGRHLHLILGGGVMNVPASRRGFLRSLAALTSCWLPSAAIG